MDIYEAIYTTRAMRRLKPDAIPYDVQARILDAAIRAPKIGDGWRFILVDDPGIKSQLAPLYRKGFEQVVGGALEEVFAEVLKTDTPMRRVVRSSLYLVNHFAEIPRPFKHLPAGRWAQACSLRGTHQGARPRLVRRSGLGQAPPDTACARRRDRASSPDALPRGARPRPGAPSAVRR